MTPKLTFCFLFVVELSFFLTSENTYAQHSDRWQISVNNDKQPLDVLMEIGNTQAVTYLFDITRDTLNLSFVAEEALEWKKHEVSMFAMPKGKEVLRLNLEEEDMENIQIVFNKMWEKVPENFRNVITFFELREKGITEEGKSIDHLILQFKMKKPRTQQSFTF